MHLKPLFTQRLFMQNRINIFFILLFSAMVNGTVKTAADSNYDVYNFHNEVVGTVSLEEKPPTEAMILCFTLYKTTKTNKRKDSNFKFNKNYALMSLAGSYKILLPRLKGKICYDDSSIPNPNFEDFVRYGIAYKYNVKYIKKCIFADYHNDDNSTYIFTKNPITIKQISDRYYKVSFKGSSTFFYVSNTNEKYRSEKKWSEKNWKKLKSKVKIGTIDLNTLNHYTVVRYTHDRKRVTENWVQEKNIHF